LTHPHRGQDFLGLLPSGVDLQHIDVARFSGRKSVNCPPQARW
jgi:hypothetical protein